MKESLKDTIKALKPTVNMEFRSAMSTVVKVDESTARTTPIRKEHNLETTNKGGDKRGRTARSSDPPAKQRSATQRVIRSNRQAG